MRRNIDGVVPLLAGHERWLNNDWWARHPPGLHLQRWPCEQVVVQPPASMTWPPESSHLLRQLAPYWAGFDLCILPVRPETLAWTRVALAAAQDVTLPPLMLLVRNLNAGAVSDLLRLGADDFLLDPATPDELWARTQRLITRAAVRAPAEVRDAADATLAGEVPVREWVRAAVRELTQPVAGIGGYQAGRRQLLADFEREYTISMLRRYRGNVTHAARAGDQTRRAFWRLMHKHQLLSADFRREAALQALTARPRGSGRPEPPLCR